MILFMNVQVPASHGEYRVLAYGATGGFLRSEMPNCLLRGCSLKVFPMSTLEAINV